MLAPGSLIPAMDDFEAEAVLMLVLLPQSLVPGDFSRKVFRATRGLSHWLFAFSISTHLTLYFGQMDGLVLMARFPLLGPPAA
jgi:hypothetical protein